MKRFLACIAAIALASACGVAEDKVAATVNSREISNADLHAFAATPFVKSQAQTAGGLSANLPGSAGGATLRVAIQFQIQTLVFEDAVKARKGSVTPQDLDQAEQTLKRNETDPQTGQSRPIDPAAREVLKRFVAAESALGRILSADVPAAQPTPQAISDYFDAHRAEYASVSCVEGFAVQSDLASKAQAAIDRGTKVSAIVAMADLQAQPLSQTGEPQCVLPVAVTNPTLAPVVFNSPVGKWASVPVDNGQGSTLVVFVRPVSRTDATAQTPEVSTAITKLLAQQTQQQSQTVISARFNKILRAADVTVDPQIGSWNPKNQTQLVLPPPVPSAPSSAKPLANKLPGSSAP